MQLTETRLQALDNPLHGFADDRQPVYHEKHLTACPLWVFGFAFLTERGFYMA
jgi:hypothetical protein